jgi:hypothetical protein
LAEAISETAGSKNQNIGARAEWYKTLDIVVKNSDGRLGPDSEPKQLEAELERLKLGEQKEGKYSIVKDSTISTDDWEWEEDIAPRTFRRAARLALDGKLP